MISRSLEALRNNCMLDSAAEVCSIITFPAKFAVVKEMLKNHCDTHMGWHKAHLRHKISLKITEIRAQSCKVLG